VIRLPGVSSDVYPSDLVVAGQFLKFLPQVPIHDRLSSRGAPLCRSADYAESLLQFPVELVFGALKFGIVDPVFAEL
jgi:hypothetical protein